MTAGKKPLSEGTRPAAPRLVVGSLPRSKVEPRGFDPASGGGVSGGARSDGGIDGGIGETDPAREPMLRAQQGDAHAFRTLVEMFQNRVMRVMVSVLHCDRAMAEDLCQEVFLRVHKGLTGFDGQVRFAAWLHTISMNVAISEYRRRRAQKRDRRTLSIDVPVAGTDDLYLTPAGRELDPGERVDQQEFLAKVRASVRDLPEEYREAVVLRDLESLSYEEIAHALDLPIGTVRSRIHRGRLLLQQKLQEFRP